MWLSACDIRLTSLLYTYLLVIWVQHLSASTDLLVIRSQPSCCTPKYLLVVPLCPPYIYLLVASLLYIPACDLGTAFMHVAGCRLLASRRPVSTMQAAKKVIW